MKSIFAFFFAAVAAPFSVQAADLIVDANGIPTDANYTDLKTGAATRGQVTSTQSFWANYTNGGNIGVSNNVGLMAANGTGHAKITTGTFTDTSDWSTFTPLPGAQLVANGPFKTASLWLASGRVSLDAAGRLATAGPVYACGGQLWFSTVAETITNPIYLGTSTYNENNAYGNAAIRVELNTTLSGTVTVLTPAKIAFNSSKTLIMANLAGSADLTFVGNATGNTALINGASTYTGTLITQTNATLSFGPAVTQAPNITLAGGAFRPLTPITLGAQNTFTGTLNLDTPPAGDSAMMTVPAGAMLDLTGATLNFAIPGSYPYTYKVFDFDPDSTVIGWNDSLTLTLGGAGSIYALTTAADGTITIDLATQPITFTPPSDYWSNKTPSPAEALIVSNVTANKGFGVDSHFDQTLGEKTSTVAHVTGGSGEASLFGLCIMGGTAATGGNGVGVTRDIWLKVTGGTFNIINGVCENSWGGNSYSPLAGDVLVELAGNTTANHVIAGSTRGSGNSNVTTVTGNTGIVIKDSAIVGGNIIGANTTAHNQIILFKGDTALLIENVQPINSATLTDLPGQSIIGGGAWVANSASCTQVDGNTAITIAIPPETAAANFAKAIIGGSYASASGSSAGNNFSISGNSTITITAPETITFTAPITGAGYSAKTVPSSVAKNSTVTINGGTFTSTLIAGGYGASSTVGGNATLTLNGGTFTGATLRGTGSGTVTGEKRLNINTDTDLSASTLSDFSIIAIAEGKFLTLGTSTFANTAITGGIVKQLTLPGGQTLAPASTTLEGATLSGGTLRPTAPITLTSKTTLAGTINLATLPPGDSAMMTVPAGAEIDLTGATFAFPLQSTYPFTYKAFAFDPEATVTGWSNSLAFTVGGAANPAYTLTAHADGSITISHAIAPITFTVPSDYWQNKPAPTEATTLGNVDTKMSFGLDPAYTQLIGGKTATVAQVTGGGGATIQLAGLHTYGFGTGADITRDIWLKVTGGAYSLVMGGCENNWLNNQASPIIGDIFTELSGTAITANLVGGSIKGGYKAGVTGNIGLAVTESARVTGSIIGGNGSSHAVSTQVTGNTALLITSAQTETLEDSKLDNLPPGYIIGGGAWTSNTGASCAPVDGNTAITIDLPGSAPQTFVKTIIGGGYSGVGSGNANVSGSTSITIKAPAAITFASPIYGGGYVALGTANAASAAITLHGGTYTSTITPAGANAGADITGSATLTLSGGIYNGATLKGSNGGSVGGSKALIVTENIDLSASMLSDFDTITIAGGKALTVGTSSFSALAVSGGMLKGLAFPANENLTLNSTTLEGFNLTGTAFTTTGTTTLASGKLAPTAFSDNTAFIKNTGALTLGAGVSIELGDLAPGSTCLLVENNGGTVDASALSTANFTRHGITLATGIAINTLEDGSIAFTFTIPREPATLGWNASVADWRTSTRDPDPGYNWDMLGEDRTPTGETAAFMVDDTACFLALSDSAASIAITGIVAPRATIIAPGEGKAYTFTGEGTIGGSGSLTLESGRTTLHSTHAYTGATAIGEGATLTYAIEEGLATYDRTVTGKGTIEIPLNADYASTLKLGSAFEGTARVTAGAFTLNTATLGSGALALASGVGAQFAANATITTPITFEGNHEIHANTAATDARFSGILTGTGFTKKGTGTLSILDSASHNLSGTLAVDAGTFWWGRNTNAPAAGATRTLGSEIAIASGATVTIHVATFSANTASATDKVNLATAIRFNGGRLYSEDGSYYFSKGFNVSGSGTFAARWTKGWVVGSLSGSGTFNILRESSSDANFSTFTLNAPGSFSGTVALASNDGNAGHGMELRLIHADALPSATIDTGANAARTRLTLGTATATIAGLTGSAPVTLASGTAAATLTINNTAACTFSGTIAGAIAINKTGTGTLTLNSQTYASAISVAGDAGFGGSGTFTGAITFAQGARLIVTPATDATGLPSFSGTITGRATVPAPAAEWALGINYYIAKGSAATAEHFIAPEGYTVKTDATGAYITAAQGVLVTIR